MKASFPLQSISIIARRPIPAKLSGTAKRMLIDAVRDRIPGVTLAKILVSNPLAGLVRAINHAPGTKRCTIHLYPTLAKALKHAAGKRRRVFATQGGPALMTRFHEWRHG